MYSIDTIHLYHVISPILSGLSRRLREWHAWHADGGQVHRILRGVVAKRFFHQETWETWEIWEIHGI